MSPQSINVQLPAAVAGLVSESALAGYGNLATGGDFSSSNKEIKAQLAGLTPGCLFDDSVSNLAMADGCLAGLWLLHGFCLLYTSPSPRDLSTSRMPSSA